MEAGAAARLAFSLETGMPLDEAVQQMLDSVAGMTGEGGVIVVTADGRLAVGFNSPDMAYGIALSGSESSEVARAPFVRVQ